MLSREWLIFSLVALFSVWPSGPLSVLATSGVLVHFVSGKRRWQMVGLYAATVLVSIGLAYDLFKPQVNRDWAGRPQNYHTKLHAWGPFSLGVLPWLLLPLLAATLLMDYAFGLGTLMQPSGPFPVGTLCHVVTTPTLSFGLRLYYPAQRPTVSPRSVQTTVPSAPYFRHGTVSTHAIARFASLPRFVFDHLVHVQHSILPGPPMAVGSDGTSSGSSEKLKHGVFNGIGEASTPRDDSCALPARLPLVVFSHGLGGIPDVYQCIIQELASNGFLVAAIEHNDGSAAVTILPTNPPRLYEPLTPAEKSDDVLSFRRRNRQLHQRANEAIAAVDFILACGDGKAGAADLAASEMPTLLKGRVDARRIGIIGHSFGAATAIVAAARDARICACVALDPWLLPITRSVLVGAGGFDETQVNAVASGTTVLAGKPVLTLFGDEFTTWKYSAAGTRVLFHHNNIAALDVVHPHLPKLTKQGPENTVIDPSPDADLVHPSTVIATLKNAEHQNFCDFALFGAVVMRRMKSIGSLDPIKAFEVINTLVLHHFHEAFAAADRSRKYYVSFDERQSLGRRAEALRDKHCNVWERIAIPDIIASLKK